MLDTSPACQEPVFVGDNVALDFVNTRYGVGAGRCECFVDDRGVVDWLKRAELLPEDFDASPKGLAVLARKLRENARVLLDAARAREEADVAVVNHVLRVGRPTRELEWDRRSGAFKLVERRSKQEAARLLEPVADALVKLLTVEAVESIRQCEAHDCTLLFHDATKSQRRRWCSMAVCGNRVTVAAFRSRKKVG